MDTTEIENKIAEIEKEMQAPDFWQDKSRAQERVRELQDLKMQKEGSGKYDRGNAIVSIVAGADKTETCTSAEPVSFS